MNSRILIVFLVFLLALACTPERRSPQNESIQQELSNRRIKRVTEVQLIEGTQRYGKPAADSLTSLLYDKVDPTKPFVCDAAHYASPALKFRLVQRYSLVCQDNPNLLPKEREIWQAYQYNVQNKLSIAENVQRIDENSMLYTSPVTINEKLVGMWSVLVDKKELVKEL